MSVTKVTWPQLSRQHQSWSGSPIIQTILVRSPFYHHRDDDDDDDESLDDDDELELGDHQHHGFPANSPHDKIPPWWEYVINR